jgi:hypothetical protein
MSHPREFFTSRVAIVCISLAIAIFTSAPLRAQQKPIVVEPNNVAPAAAKAVSVINKSGSFILNKNIVTGRANADAIDITASNVTLDLQGFSIISTSLNTADAINATGQTNVIVRNGTISGFGGTAIVGGTGTNISGITASGNEGGIVCGIGCVARDNVIQGNTGVGMIFSDVTSGYVGNVLQGNDQNTVGTTGQVSGGTSLGQNLCNGIAC